MARFVVGAAALLALSRAEEWGSQPQPGEYGYDDKKNAMTEYLNPKSVPGHDKCGVDCWTLCKEGLGRTRRVQGSNSDCINSCYAHSIETPRAKSGMFDSNRQQGKYVQKVMAEYCDRGLCGAKLLQASVQKHEQQQGEEYSPNAWKGDPRAMPSGWPSTCETEQYYCQELCQNLYHKPTSNLGEHFGASERNWSKDQKQCKQDCSRNFKGLIKYYDSWCKCFKSPGGDMNLESVPGLLQEKQETESVDVGAFMQMPQEL